MRMETVTGESLTTSLGCDGHYVALGIAPEVGAWKITHEDGIEKRELWVAEDRDVSYQELGQLLHAKAVEV